MMKKTILLLLTACLLLAAIPLRSAAVTPVDVNRACSMTLYYARSRKGFEAVAVQGYRVAEVAEDGTYTLTGEFADYPVNIYGITSQTEWKEVTGTLAAYAAADGLEPDLKMQTDSTGTARFTELKTGMYLICAVDVIDGDTMCLFEDFLVCLPAPEEDGFAYEVSAAPKYDSYSLKPAEVEFQVVKLWKETDGGRNRPASVSVQILKDGAVQSTQTLSAENDWTYRWKAPDDGSRWQVVERQVPAGYQVIVQSDGRNFAVTNTHVGQQEKPPQTGDTSVLWPYALAMCLSGGLLMVLGMYEKRKRP